ncbi:MAG: TetR/AcrR family transcriptional regulator [Pseudomonadota bacterium]
MESQQTHLSTAGSAVRRRSNGLQAYRDRVAREKRSRLLDAAVERFLADGYDRTTLEAVARGAGVSSATLYKHFPTKSDLFGGVMARVWESQPGAPETEPTVGDPREGLTVIGRDYAARLARPQSVDLYRLVIAEAPRFPALGADLHDRARKPYLERLRAYLRRAVEAGELAIDDLTIAERQFLAMIADLVFWPRLLLVGHPVSESEIAAAVDQAVETFLHRHAA